MRRLSLAPLREYLHTETAGAVGLLAATVAALAWANTGGASYHDVWTRELGALSLHEWVNDALMAVFFLVVGLEIKREVLAGELRDPRRAALPAVAALGGMVVPAALYLLFNAGRHGAHGWAIPMATDIAFALGVLALVGRGLPSSLRLFLLTLAIVDDLGAIAVIAVVYSSDVDLAPLVLAVVLLAAIPLLARTGVRWTPLHVALAITVWWAVHESGIHATVAGVALGFVTPLTPHDGADESTLEWLERALHPWSSYVIVPLFALANAGVRIGADGAREAATSPVTLGVVAGLVVGKFAGIAGTSWLAVRAGVGSLPDGATWRQFSGVAAIAGIGFTVSLFVTGLAFDDAGLADEARVGILAASILAAALGAALLRYRQR